MHGTDAEGEPRRSQIWGRLVWVSTGQSASGLDFRILRVPRRRNDIQVAHGRATVPNRVAAAYSP
jgi:hypothetical protein